MEGERQSRLTNNKLLHALLVKNMSDSDIDDQIRAAVISQYQQELKESRSMEQAVREAEIALMSHPERFKFAALRLHKRKEGWQRDLQKSLEQYRRTVLSCPLSYHQSAQEFVEADFPFLVLPHRVGEKVLLQIRQSVEKQLVQKYGNHPIVSDVCNMWYKTTKQYLGFSEGAVPHPDVLPCIIPNVKK